MTRLSKRCAVLILLLSFTLPTGCIGIVRNRTPKIPRRKRNVAVPVAPDIDVVFECTSTQSRDGAGTGLDCGGQREALVKVMPEFDYLANAHMESGDHDYLLVVRTVTERGYKVADPLGGEECIYWMMMLAPCISMDRLEAGAELRGPGGVLVGEASASAGRAFVTHFTGIWLFPFVFPSLPAYVRFSTNTYRNLLAEIGMQLADSQQEGPP